jgi:hypothetical protein
MLGACRQPVYARISLHTSVNARMDGDVTGITGAVAPRDPFAGPGTKVAVAAIGGSSFQGFHMMEDSRLLGSDNLHQIGPVSVSDRRWMPWRPA